MLFFFWVEQTRKGEYAEKEAQNQKNQNEENRTTKEGSTPRNWICRKRHNQSAWWTS